MKKNLFGSFYAHAGSGVEDPDWTKTPKATDATLRSSRDEQTPVQSQRLRTAGLKKPFLASFLSKQSTVAKVKKYNPSVFI